ncbi:acetyl-CoA C-acyltransferase [Mycolicibacterium thermoresistibile]
MSEVFIVDAIRTPMGRRNGGLSTVHPTDLGAELLVRLVERNNVDPKTIDDVVLGCINQIGAQSANLARNCVLSAGFPDTVPGVTVDRQCGSSQQALHFAAQGVLAGSYDLAIAGGLEVMSLVPLNSGFERGPELGVGHPFQGDGWVKRFGPDQVHQFFAGERIAEKWKISRQDMEAFAQGSNERAASAWDKGHFDREVTPVNELSTDETIRRNSTLEKLATLDPILDGGVLTAGTASQIADGASAVLVASAAAVRRYGLTPRAAIRSMVVAGSDPWLMLTGPIPATEKALAKADLKLDDIDLFEVNEAFASVVLAWSRETGADLEKTNVNGGAIALGHALGATGTRLMTTLLNELERRDARFGLETVCEGGGLANATVIERV